MQNQDASLGGSIRHVLRYLWVSKQLHLERIPKTLPCFGSRTFWLFFVQTQNHTCFGRWPTVSACFIGKDPEGNNLKQKKQHVANAYSFHRTATSPLRGNTIQITRVSLSLVVRDRSADYLLSVRQRRCEGGEISEGFTASYRHRTIFWLNISC